MTDEQTRPLDVDLRHGDALDVLRTLPANSVHAVITDPPYGLSNTTPAQVVETVTRWARGERDYVPAGKGFMGRPWDAFVPPPALWDEAFRVLRPGGHLLSFASTRTLDLMTLAIRFAGFDVRDGIGWIYGSGFPKNLDVSAEIDKLDAAAERRERALEFTAWMRSTGITTRAIDAATGTAMGGHYLTDKEQPTVAVAAQFDKLRPLLPAVPERIEQLVHERTVESANYAARASTGVHDKPAQASQWRANYTGEHVIPAGRDRRDLPHTPEAEQWHGWGTALKPALEPIAVARKPLAGTVAVNVLAHGTGALNIDACRVHSHDSGPKAYSTKRLNPGATADATGSWRPADAETFESSTGDGRWPTNVVLDDEAAAALDAQTGDLGKITGGTVGAKAAGRLGAFAGLDRPVVQYDDTGGASRFYPVFRYAAKAPASERPVVDGVAHETVKPLDLMRWLVRLFAAPGSTILEPFAGSGTTVEAAVRERCRVIAIEREARYLPLIRARVERCTLPGLHAVELPPPPATVETSTTSRVTRAAAAAAAGEQLDLFGEVAS